MREGIQVITRLLAAKRVVKIVELPHTTHRDEVVVPLLVSTTDAVRARRAGGQPPEFEDFLHDHRRPNQSPFHPDEAAEATDLRVGEVLV
jgi:hypothetical protein